MAAEALREVRVNAVGVAKEGESPILVLETVDREMLLPIWVGMPEAAGILVTLKGETTPRPLTHDLFTDTLAKLEVRMVRATVTDLRENTFYAEITLSRDGAEVTVDARPSDAVALAVRAGAPIFVSARVIDAHGVRAEQLKDSG